ncbi:hypothetical protein Q3G72_011132 [Acer saccharum]|nr:hypothetical protein Q3G72_011132 [Acer saccharum]
MDIQKNNHHRGEDRKTSRDWSRLPETVIATISDKLSLCEFLSFSDVCKPWRSFQKQTSMMNYRNPLRGFPWLVMSKDMGSEPKRCFSVLENKLCLEDEDAEG